MNKAITDFSSIAEANSNLVLSVNLSNRQLMQADFNTWLVNIVSHSSMKPHQLKLEITESITQIGIARAKEILNALRDSGFKLSLDDFGTGYSSLSHLHNLPINELKIDMSFVRRFQQKEGKIMLETIAVMGNSLGLELVAEGVETSECVNAMSALEVTRLQGYYFSAAKPWSEALHFINTDFNEHK